MRYAALLLALAACGTKTSTGISTANDSTSGAAAIAAKTAALTPGLTLADLPVYFQNTPVAGFYTQLIDHPTSGTATIGTWQQRYWYSTEFASGPDAPVLLSLCEEAECGPELVELLADEAKSLGASVVSLEHRYYGPQPNQPFSDESKAHMKYLTVHNALEDNATFTVWAKTNLPLSGKWIPVGGSYSGALAAYLRLTHPEIYVGAWASSAPVNITLSFTGYDLNESQAVGPTCTLLVQQALAAADVAYKDPTQCAALATSMYNYPDMCSWDETDFLDEVVTGTVQGAAQYGYQTTLCDALLQDKTNPLQGFIDYINPPLARDTTAPQHAPGTMTGTMPRPHSGFPILPAHVDPAQTDYAGNEWYYQVCTEMGYFQVANADRDVSVEPDSMNTAYFQAGCKAFVDTEPTVTTMNRTYYKPLVAGKATNVLYVTGSQDPWSNLSFTDPGATPAGNTAFTIEGGSHCQDLNPLDPNQILGVFEAHKMFHDLAVTWLAE